MGGYWQSDDPLPPNGVYELLLEDGRLLTRPMSPDWVWYDTFGGSRISAARLVSEQEKSA